MPHGEVRSSILGQAERAPTRSELDRMKQLVERDMRAGAWGLSTGLIYVPGRYAHTDELIELARVVRGHGGIYASHIRSEGAGLLAAVDEAIAVGEGAKLPVHISHLKASGKPYWGTVRGAIDRIAAARAAGMMVSADQYPYIASSTKLAAMVVPHWAAWVDGNEFARLAADPCAAPSYGARSSAIWSSGTAGRRSGSRGTSRGPSGPASTWSRSPRGPARRRSRSSWISSGTAARRRSASACARRTSAR